MESPDRLHSVVSTQSKGKFLHQYPVHCTETCTALAGLCGGSLDHSRGSLPILPSTTLSRSQWPSIIGPQLTGSRSVQSLANRAYRSLNVARDHSGNEFP